MTRTCETPAAFALCMRRRPFVVRRQILTGDLGFHHHGGKPCVFAPGIGRGSLATPSANENAPVRSTPGRSVGSRVTGRSGRVTDQNRQDTHPDAAGSTRSVDTNVAPFRRPGKAESSVVRTPLASVSGGAA